MTVPAFPSPAEARREEGALRARDGLDLFWQRYRPEAPRATVAVLHGGGDHSGRYPGLTAALVRAGMEVALLDFRGHGRSGGARWHVMRFEEYLEDLEVFLERVRADAAGRRLFLVGHSQGGLIAARWGLDPMRPVAGVVLSSPWLRLAFEPPRRLAFTWNAPPTIPTIRDSGVHTLVYVELEPLAADKTRVTMTHTGWGVGEDWDKTYAYFDKAWEAVLSNLRYRFAVGPVNWPGHFIRAEQPPVNED